MEKIEEIVDIIKRQVFKSRERAVRNGNPLSCGMHILEYYLDNMEMIKDSKVYLQVKKSLAEYF